MYTVLDDSYTYINCSKYLAPNQKSVIFHGTTYNIKQLTGNHGFLCFEQSQVKMNLFFFLNPIKPDLSKTPTTCTAIGSTVFSCILRRFVAWDCSCDCKLCRKK